MDFFIGAHRGDLDIALLGVWYCMVYGGLFIVLILDGSKCEAAFGQARDLWVGGRGLMAVCVVRLRSERSFGYVCVCMRYILIGGSGCNDTESLQLLVGMMVAVRLGLRIFAHVRGIFILCCPTNQRGSCYEYVDTGIQTSLYIMLVDIYRRRPLRIVKCMSNHCRWLLVHNRKSRRLSASKGS